MTVYVFNAPILTNYGSWTFQRSSLEDAKYLLSRTQFVSAIGHPATAEILTKLLNLPVSLNRIEAKMRQGDVAIVFRLKKRMPEGTVLSSVEQIEEIGYEFGILKLEWELT